MSVAGTIDNLPSRTLGRAVVRERLTRLLDVSVAIWIFSGGFVLIEPSPYEVTFFLVLVLALAAGLGLYRSTLGLLALIVAFTPFALIAAFQVKYSGITDALIFNIVTIFLLLTSYVVANYVADQPERRMRIVINAYTAAAVLCAVIGTLAYLGLMPNSELFLRYGRAKATFNDSNVYGPFLILPAMFALQRILLGRKTAALIASAIYLILFVGVFVSFSRAAWGHFAASSIMTLLLVFAFEAHARDKVRVMIMTLAGAGFLVVAMAGLLSIPAVGTLFETRTQSQNYDSGETGRFGRQGYAFDLALANPWGIGPGEFRNLRVTEEPHNVYVSVLHVYGWGGGAMFYLLILLTLWRGYQGVRHGSPYRLMMIPLISTFVMLAIESAIIDSDHWRHLFLIAGLIWGVAAAANANRGRVSPRERMLV